MVVMQPHPTHIIYQCAKFGDYRMSFNVIFDVATFNMLKAYISIFLASKLCPILKYSDIYDLCEPVTIVIFNESLQTFVYTLPVG